MIKIKLLKSIIAQYKEKNGEYPDSIAIDKETFEGLYKRAEELNLSTGSLYRTEILTICGEEGIDNVKITWSASVPKEGIVLVNFQKDIFDRI